MSEFDGLLLAQVGEYSMRNYCYSASPSELDLNNQVAKYPGYKAMLRRFALRIGNVSRIHIIGAARSGTTMLHYAMLAFDGTTLYDKEASPEFAPALGEAFLLTRSNLQRRAQLQYVTKRNALWISDAAIQQLMQRIRNDHIGLINIIRDPRDVLTSTHKNAPGNDYYLDPKAWVRSISAADVLADCASPTLTIRYEDVVLRAEQTQALVANHFGLRLRPGVVSWATLRSNLAKLRVTPSMEAALHRLRDFDPNSIGGWRRDTAKRAYIDQLLCDQTIGPKIREILARYAYKD